MTEKQILNVVLACLGTLLVAISAVIWTKLETLDERTREMDKVLAVMAKQYEYQHGALDKIKAAPDGQLRVAE